MRDTFQCEVGLSDHTLGIGVAVAGVALGASVIEKHFVLSRDAGGVDAAFSLQPEELKILVLESQAAALARGQVLYGGDSSEQASKKYRRSIYISEDVQAGDILTEQNIKVVRPGLGLAPKYYQSILGKKVTQAANKGTAVTWELFKEKL